MSQTELNRIQVLEKTLGGLITTGEAALILGLSERHIYRLKARLQELGPASLAHGNRGRKPAHTIPDNIRQQVVQLAQTKYWGCNYTFLSELLHEYEGISISPSSVARILKAAGISSPKKHRPPKLHRSRQRKPQIGLLVQIDGSHHDWLEGRGPKLVLLLAIDDATGQILAALFWPSEDFEGYCRLLYDLVTNHGIPLAIYSDRHTLFFSPKDEKHNHDIAQQLLGQQRPLTQIGRILNELGIYHIPANSPQAKGRIERSFQTLQERLVVELRLADASTLEEANAVLKNFIKRYNQKFAVPPADPTPAFRPIPSHLRLEHIFCWKELRTLNPGYTIRFKRKTYKVLTPKGAPVIPLRSVVEVHKLPHNRLFVGWKGFIYPLEPLELAPHSKTQHNPDPAPSPHPNEKAGSSPVRRPAQNHPWRKPWKPRT
ncbi:MAG: ISNCY family transposase, partial [Infirmifilum uzonense]|uniref:ISNCY family transposase n=1 Tax=Infirmifilum uzonense TaxID=1550241 RepID=UPI003C793F80